MSSTLGSGGLKPISLMGQQGNTTGFRQMKIASGYATSIFAGDPLILVTAGTVERQTSVTNITTCGVFMGVSYTDATLGFIQRQYWPANTVASDAYAYVCDDPDMLFVIQSDETLGQAAIGANADLVQTAAGSTTTGNSGLNLDGSTVATNAATSPLRIIDFWDRGEIDSTYPLMVVKINEGDHQYRITAGV